jgi:hypothetical protein
LLWFFWKTASLNYLHSPPLDCYSPEDFSLPWLPGGFLAFETRIYLCNLGWSQTRDATVSASQVHPHTQPFLIFVTKHSFICVTCELSPSPTRTLSKLAVWLKWLYI